MRTGNVGQLIQGGTASTEDDPRSQQHRGPVAVLVAGLLVVVTSLCFLVWCAFTPPAIPTACPMFEYSGGHDWAGGLGCRPEPYFRDAAGTFLFLDRKRNLICVVITEDPAITGFQTKSSTEEARLLVGESSEFCLQRTESALVVARNGQECGRFLLKPGAAAEANRELEFAQPRSLPHWLRDFSEVHDQPQLAELVDALP